MEDHIANRETPKALIWISCFITPPDSIYQKIDQISKILRNNDVEVLVVSSHDLSIFDYTFSAMKIPFHLSETGREYGEFFSGDALPMSSAVLKEFVDIDRAWGQNASSGEFELDVLRGALFWERAFSILQPSAMLSWGNTAPMSRMWAHLARRFQRPHFIVERGVMENTLNYSVVGQGALSDFSTLLSLVDPSREDNSLDERWKRIEDYYESIAFRHYAEINKLADKQLDRIEAIASPAILYLGSFDIGSGIAFDHNSLGDLHDPWMKSSVLGARQLIACLKAMPEFDGSLIVKPHPGSNFDLPEEPDLAIHFFRDTDVYRLIEAADVVVTLSSSTSFLGLLKGKPTVTMANIQFMGREATYEARSPAQLHEALKQALAKTDWNERLLRGRRLIAAAFRDALIGLDENVPTRFKVEDFAQLLARFKNYAPADALPAGERIKLFKEFSHLACDASPTTSSGNSFNLNRDRIEQARLLDRVKQETAVLRQLIVEHEAEKSRFNIALDQERSRNAELEQVANELAVMRADHHLQESERVAQLEQLSTAHEAERFQLLAALDEERSKCVELEQISRRQQEQLNRAANEIETTQARHEADELESAAKLERLIADNAAENSQLQLALDLERSRICDLEKTANRQQAQLAQAALDIDSARARHELEERESAAELGRLAEDRASLSAECDRLRADLQDSAGAAAILEARAGAAEAEVLHKGDEVTALTGRFSDLNAKYNDTSNQLQAARQESVTLRAMLSTGSRDWAQSWQVERKQRLGEVARYVQLANAWRETRSRLEEHDLQLDLIRSNLMKLLNELFNEANIRPRLQIFTRRAQLDHLMDLFVRLELAVPPAELDENGRQLRLKQGRLVNLLASPSMDLPVEDDLCVGRVELSYEGKIDEDDLVLISSSPLFQPEWYYQTYPDAAALDMDAACHYLWIGAALGYNPSSQFDTQQYLIAHPEIVALGINPLVHSLMHGEAGIRT